MISGMKVPGSSSPTKLAISAGVGCLLISSPFLLLTIVHVPRLQTSGCGVGAILWENCLRLLVFFIPSVCGLTIVVLAEKRLRTGPENEVWRESEVELLRRRIGHPVWSLFNWLLIVAWLGYLVRGVSSHGAPLFWSLMIPAQMISRLKMMVRPKRVAGGGELQDWRNFKPIQSEHWGEPR
jgi:hypothetical protein